MLRLRRFERAQPLVSVHIPKCAGTSLGIVLRSWFGEGYFQHYANESQNRAPERHRLWDVDGRSLCISPCVIHGHFNRHRGFGVEHYYPHARQLITVLRNPLAMKISNYRYVRDSAANQSDAAKRAGKPHPIVANGWSLPQFIENETKCPFLAFLPREINRDNYKEILESRYVFIGIAERLSTDVAMLAEILGFGAVGVPVANASTDGANASTDGDDEVEDALRDRFMAENELEYAIYDHVESHVHDTSG